MDVRRECLPEFGGGKGDCWDGFEGHRLVGKGAIYKIMPEALADQVGGVIHSLSRRPI